MSQIPTASPMGGGMMRPHRGTMILVFGILGLVVCFIFGIVAWVMGNSDLAAMQRGEMDPSGEGMVKAGKICGMIAALLNLISVGLVFFLVILGGALGAAGAAGP